MTSSKLRHHHRRHDVSPLYQFTTSSSEFDKDYSKYNNDNVDNEDDANARSQFGTKLYWDAMYDVHFPDDVEALFGLAYERYRFGNGSLRREGSISRLAKDVRRDIVPSFPQFRRYFKSDENYADNIIVSGQPEECISSFSCSHARTNFYSISFILG